MNSPPSESVESGQEKHSRKELITQKMGFNQMRNSIYILQRYMNQHHLSDKDIRDRLINMGKNIGATFVTQLETSPKDLSLLLRNLYKITVNSKVKVEVVGDSIIVRDSRCSLCKYQYDDISVPGCNIIIAMISEMLIRLGYQVTDQSIVQSKTFGDKLCEHRYVLKEVEQK
ncbi:MAG: hypothetical protein ACTSWW_04610 [Promethearchaeota archaeon]